MPLTPSSPRHALGWATPLRTAGRALLDLVFPPRCAGCGRLGEFFCPDCQGRVPPVPLGFCPRCGEAAPTPARLCPPCRRAFGGLDGILATGMFVAPLREAVYALKYHGVRGLAEPLGERLTNTWKAVGEPADLIVPVPLYELREAERGYNQAALLARALAPRLELPLQEHLLARQKPTASQVGLSLRERRENVHGAFAACGSVRGLRILLVDDVCTTGATLGACATVLHAAGARTVWGLAVARAGLDPS